MAMITVHIWLASENRRQEVELPDDTPTKQVLAVLLNRLQLPHTAPDGQALGYRFCHKRSGRRLSDEQCFADAGVQHGDVLRLELDPPHEAHPIVCPECRKQAGGNFASCPECGYPFRQHSTRTVPPPAVPRAGRAFTVPARDLASPLPHSTVCVLAFAFLGVLVIVVGCAIFMAGPPQATYTGTGFSKPDSAQTGSPEIQERVLVVIVPGTYGNERFWPNIIESKVTFASEMKAALGPNSDVYPFVWASSVFHSARVEAAHNLAEVVDRQATAFDRVCLVGHSHGGNVALMAAALCEHRVDTIVCLSTPHVYLRTVLPSGETTPVPVYCSLRTIANTDRIITITPNTDSVPDIISNQTLTGLTENEAILLTTDWREALNHPRLANDSLTFRLFESGNIQADKYLPSFYDEGTRRGIWNCSVFSLVQDTVRIHGCIHSRRMGYVIGELIRDACDAHHIDFLRHMIQPEDSDSGEAVSIDEHARVVCDLVPKYEHAGWVLQQIGVVLHTGAKQVADEADPDPYVSLTSTKGLSVIQRTTAAQDKLAAIWSPGWFIPDGSEFVLEVWDAEFLGSDVNLGGWRCSSVPTPPDRLDASAAKGIYWSATLDWIPVHY